MSKVCFGDIVREVKVNIDRSNNPYEYYVAGDHMDTEELHISRRGSFAEPPEPGPAFIRVFKPGQILYGSRRTYLKKVAVADFAGICSNTTFVLETKNDNVFLQRLLPFLMYSEQFTKFSIDNSKGSTNPYILFSDLAKFEFDLPPLSKQRKLSDLLWAANATREAYKKLLGLTDEIVKSRFIEMFGDPVTNPMGWEVKRLDKISTTRLGKMLDSKQQTGKDAYPYLANFNVQWFRLNLETLNKMDFNEADRNEFALRYGDLLICEGGEVGRTAIWKNELSNCFFQKAIHRVRCNEKCCIPEYLAWVMYFKANVTHFDGIIAGATIAHLTGEKLKALKIQVPPLDLQNQFAEFVRQADKSKFTALCQTKMATLLYNSITGG